MFKGKKGFSLVELMIVVAIIGILVAALLPQLQNMISSAKESNAKQSLKALADAITRFNAVEPRECQKLEWLVPNYMKELKRDPWGSPYSIDYINGVIFSYGPDKKAYTSGATNIRLDSAARDNIEFYYKPKLGLSEVKLSLDLDGNSKLNNGDRITIFFTRPANTNGNVLPDDYIYTDRFEDDKANEVWLYNNSPAGYTGAPAAFMWVGTGTVTQYITDLDGSGGFESSPAGSVSFIAVSPTDASTFDETQTTGSATYVLSGTDTDTYVTFQMVAPSDFELNTELFVRFAPDSVKPQVGKYTDSRGNVAISNGYNVKVETYF